METKHRTKIGVIGVGKMGFLHLTKYLALPEAEVIGVFDSSPATALEVQRKTGVRVYSSVDDLLFDADAVSIATPTESHYRVARHAFDSGVHVLLEKPIADTVEQAEELVRISREKGLVFQIGFVERFRFRALTKTLPSSKVLFIESDRLALAVGREAQIDVVSDLMIHDLDLALSLIPEEPNLVSAIGLPVITPLVDAANARLEFPGGAVVNLNASRVSDKKMRKFRVFTSNHYASIDFLSNTVDIARHDGVARLEHQSLEYNDFDALKDQSLQFIECARAGLRPIVSGEDGLRALRVAKLIRQRIQERLANREFFPSQAIERSPELDDLSLN